MRNFFLGWVVTLAVAGFAYAQSDGPDVTAIVEAQAAFEAAPGKQTRKTLDAALDAYKGEPTIESLNAHLVRVRADSAKSPSALRKSAVAAADHLEPAADVLPKQFADLRYMAAVALFNFSQKRGALDEMAHVEGLAHQLKESLKSSDESDKYEDAEGLYYNAQAWGMAMEAYFDSLNKKRSSNAALQKILEQYDADTETINAKAQAGESVDDETGEPRLSFCKGGLNLRPRLRYPNRAARKGMVGAVIAKFDQDSEGNVINAKVLASVPNEGFKDKALVTVSKWRYVPADDEQPGVTCRLERKNLIVPLTFQLN